MVMSSSHDCLAIPGKKPKNLRFFGDKTAVSAKELKGIEKPQNVD